MQILMIQTVSDTNCHRLCIYASSASNFTNYYVLYNIFKYIEVEAKYFIMNTTVLTEIKSVNGPFYIADRQNPLHHLLPRKCQWNIKENIKFSVFLSKFEQKLTTQNTIKRWTAYKLMSKFIATKNYTQCRNKHVRMIKEVGDTAQIICILEKMYSNFNELYQGFTKELNQLCASLQNNYEKIEKQQIHQQCNKFKLNNRKKQDKTALQYDNEDDQVYSGSQNQFKLKKYHSMPDFYMRMFYPHYQNNTMNSLTLMGDLGCQSKSEIQL